MARLVSDGTVLTEDPGNVECVRLAQRLALPTLHAVPSAPPPSYTDRSRSEEEAGAAARPRRVIRGGKEEVQARWAETQVLSQRVPS